MCSGRRIFIRALARAKGKRNAPGAFRWLNPAHGARWRANEEHSHRNVLPAYRWPHAPRPGAGIELQRAGKGTEKLAELLRQRAAERSALYKTYPF